jgi:hypothetical protein
MTTDSDQHNQSNDNKTVFYINRVIYQTKPGLYPQRTLNGIGQGRGCPNTKSIEYKLLRSELISELNKTCNRHTYVNVRDHKYRRQQPRFAQHTKYKMKSKSKPPSFQNNNHNNHQHRSNSFKRNNKNNKYVNTNANNINNNNTNNDDDYLLPIGNDMEDSVIASASDCEYDFQETTRNTIIEAEDEEEEDDDDDDDINQNENKNDAKEESDNENDSLLDQDTVQQSPQENVAVFYDSEYYNNEKENEAEIEIEETPLKNQNDFDDKEDGANEHDDDSTNYYF